jgi:hypothetical protein
MTNSAYLDGRKQYQRPQAVLWADNSGELDTDGFLIPTGTEYTNFLILSDDNRDQIQFKGSRIEHKERMVNGRMRAYHVADKLELDLSWKSLPSRAFSSNPNFSASGQTNTGQYTTDGGAGGVEMLDWYENNTGSFFVYLAYDKYNNFGSYASYNNLPKYNDVVEMFFSDFSYSVSKRGGSTYDFWDITIKLEEV